MDTTTETKTEMCMNAEPQDEHRWLQQMIGEWTIESECVMGPDQPPMRLKGTETMRAVGPLWIQGDGRGETPGGGTSQMQFTLGYDPDKKRFVGTFIASVMTHLWVYEGDLDDERKVLSMRVDGPDMTDPGKIAHYKDMFEIKSPDHRILTSQMLGPDGVWHRFMTAHYRRVK